MFSYLPKDIIRMLILKYFDPLSSLRFLKTSKIYKSFITNIEHKMVCDKLKYDRRVKQLTIQVFNNNKFDLEEEAILDDCIKYFANEQNYVMFSNILLQQNMRKIEKDILYNDNYISMLKKYKKKRFDAFKRGPTFNFGDQSTTVGQLNFMKWYVSDGCKLQVHQ